jgi:hypothetical protein
LYFFLEAFRKQKARAACPLFPSASGCGACPRLIDPMPAE